MGKCIRVLTLMVLFLGLGAAVASAASFGGLELIRVVYQLNGTVEVGASLGDADVLASLIEAPAGSGAAAFSPEHFGSNVQWSELYIGYYAVDMTQSHVWTSGPVTGGQSSGSRKFGIIMAEAGKIKDYYGSLAGEKDYVSNGEQSNVKSYWFNMDKNGLYGGAGSFGGFIPAGNGEANLADLAPGGPGYVDQALYYYATPNSAATGVKVAVIRTMADGSTVMDPDSGEPTVPDAPTGVTATAGNAQAAVSFTAPASDGGSPITSYTVTSSPGGITAGGSSSPITVTGLTNGAAYTFTVTATNAVGTGPASSPSNSVTPIAPSSVPGAPTGVTATAGNKQATVSFSAPALDGGSPITSYTVTSNPGGVIKTGKASPITVAGLTNGTAYTFTVTATNAVGTGTASSPSNSVTPAPTEPGAPRAVTATAGNKQATVSFKAPSSTGGSPIISYTVTSNPGGISKTGAHSPMTLTGLTNGTAYTFTVTATNAVGTGPASSPSKSVTPAPTEPGAPRAVTATAGNKQVTISFKAPSSTGGSPITSYTVTSNPGGISKTGARSPLTVKGLANGTAYTFTVTATNVMGTGPASSPSNSVTPFAPATSEAATAH